MQETWVWSLGPEDLLEKGMAPHSSILAWRISWIEESGGLLSIGLQRGGHDWANNTSIKWGQADLLQRLNSVIYETARYRRYSADAHNYCRRDNFASLVVFIFQALTREFTLPGEKQRVSRLFLLWGKKICLRQFSFYIFFCSGLFYLTIGLFRMWRFHRFQSIYFLPLLWFFLGFPVARAGPGWAGRRAHSLGFQAPARTLPAGWATLWVGHHLLYPCDFIARWRQ